LAFQNILISVESYWQIFLHKRLKVLLDFRNALTKFYFRWSRRLFMKDAQMIIMTYDSQWQTKKKSLVGLLSKTGDCLTNRPLCRRRRVCETLRHLYLFLLRHSTTSSIDVREKDAHESVSQNCEKCKNISKHLIHIMLHKQQFIIIKEAATVSLNKLAYVSNVIVNMTILQWKENAGKSADWNHYW